MTLKSECFEAYREKERAHKNFKENSRIEDNTQNIIQSDKNICNRKMRDNRYNEDDPVLITKKFWSHVKSNSKSSRLPKTMHLDNRFRNKSSEKAELFNSYFYEQFSGPSNYNTHISWSNDQAFDIDFNRNRLRKLLSSVNSNKASGPNGIHGKILKNCSESLAYILSLIFKFFYNTGSLSGVPQGSILGPILFVLFINDLHQGISTDTCIALYADDTKILRSIKTRKIWHNCRGI